MKHVRQRIREVARLVLTGLPTTGGRVYSGDPYAKEAAGGPFLRIVVPDDQADDGASDVGPTGGRRLTLLVIGEAEDARVEDVLDAIGLEVETALDGQTFGGLAKITTFARASKLFDDEGRKPAGEIRIEFSVVYRVRAGAPHEAIA